MSQHKNDTYGDIDARNEDDAGVQPPIPAATVVLLRDLPDYDGVEVLMLKKNSKITFGGMWVFPGGKIDAEDADPSGDEEATARRAAAREAEEEAALQLSPDDFVWFSHWTPPPGPQKRFATWFFAADTAGHTQDVEIDQGEIKDYAWIQPGQALKDHAAGEIDLAPPTWVTLYQLSLFPTAAAMVKKFQHHDARIYQTRVAKTASGDRAAMWAGDAGYEPWDATLDGPRHRLVMAEGGFVFEHDASHYGP
ncbi:MAG: NUDIX domain-containing protein [Pseudomonadota bacterium]